MADFQGALAPYSDGYVRNPNGTANLDGRTLVHWKAHSAYAESASPSGGSLTDNSPLPAPLGDAFLGEQAPTFADDFYNRVYFFPRDVDFGAVTAQAQVEVEVWNAFLTASTLGALSEVNLPGVSLDGPDSPQEFLPLESYNFVLTASTTGPATIAGHYSFDFGEDGTYQLDVKGSRAKLWPFHPNWRRPYRITYQYKTTVLTSHSQREQRQALRSEPRKVLEQSVTLRDREEMALFNRLMTTWQERVWVVAERTRSVSATQGAPVYSTTLSVSSTPDWVAEGVPVVLEADGYAEARTVASVSSSVITFSAASPSAWPEGTTVYAGVACRLPPEISAPRQSSTTAELKVEFSEDPGSGPLEDVPAAALTLRGRPVLLERPNWAEPVAAGHQVVVEELDYGYGRIERFRPGDFPMLTRQSTFLQRSRPEVESILDHFYRMKGRRGEFYAPTWEPDLVPIGEIVQGTPTFRVAGRETFDAFGASTVHRGVFLLLRDGSTVVRAITDMAAVASQQGSGEDTLITVGTAWPSTVAAEDVILASWLLVWRMASDDMTIEWLSDEVAQTRIAMKSLEDLEEETPS